MTTKVKTIALSAILLSSIPAIAGSSVAPITIQETTTDSGWHYKAALYAWGENLEGDVSLRGHDVDVDLGLDDILDNLDFAVMGAVEVGYDRWSFLADMSYADLSGSKNGLRTTTKVDLSQFIGNFVVT
ncbi:hypothetical protein [Rubritalea sp.]|uniref:hypothetical protein n=1 Tax=Rubritalea sp. TaxID=2109375 RepID=UPI003EF1CAF1